MSARLSCLAVLPIVCGLGCHRDREKEILRPAMGSARLELKTTPEASVRTGAERAEATRGETNRQKDGEQFFVAVDGKCTTLSVQDLEGGTFLTNGTGAGTPGESFRTRDRDAFLAILNERDKFVDRPDFLAGLQARDVPVTQQFWGARADESGHFYGAPSLGGTFPDSLWLTICDTDSASIGCSQLRWVKGRWTSVPGNNDAEAAWFWKFAGPLQNWSEGRIISRNVSSGGEYGQPFFVFESKTGKRLPSPPEAALPPGESNGFNAVARAFPSGEILLWNGSADCEREGEPCGVVFATYNPKSNRFHSYQLPGLSGYGVLVAAHPGEAWALAQIPRRGEGKSELRLIHFDGTELKVVPTTKPLFEGASLALSSPSDLWVVNQGELYRLGSGGQLNSVELPKPLYAKASAVSKVTVRFVAVARNGDIYVHGTYVNQAREAKNWTKRGIVYRSRPVTEALHCDYRADGGSILAPLPPRANEQCANPLALLTVIRKSDNPKRTLAGLEPILKQNDAFKALSIREGAFGSRRYWTVPVPSVSLGERLVAKVAEQIKHATPELVCGSPQP